MSRLIEALRKAEEAKRKNEQKNIDNVENDVRSEGISGSTSTLSLDPIDPETTYTQNSEAFELEPAELTSVEQAPDQPSGPITETSAEMSSFSDSDSEEVTSSLSSPEPTRRRQTDQILVEPPDIEYLDQPKSKKKLWLIILIVILLIGIAGIWYFVSISDSNNYSNIQNTTNRGFLGELPTKNTSFEDNNAQTSETNTDTNLINIETQISEIEASSNNPLPIDGSITNLGDTSSENTIEEFSDHAETIKTPVLQIKAAPTVKVADTSLEFATDQSRYGEHAAAINEYQELLRNQPSNQQALFGLAKLEQQLGNLITAKDLYSKLLKLNPKNSAALTGYLSSGRPSDPIAYESELKSLAKQYPNQASIPFSLGNLYSEQKKWTAAKNQFTRALETAKQNNTNSISPDFAFNLGVVYEQLAQPLSALNAYQEAKELSENIAPNFDPRVLESRLELLGRNQ